MLGQIDWASYLRVHSDRRNLLIHAFAVPLFVGSVIFLAAFLVQRAWVGAAIAVALAVVSMVLQGKGHSLESQSPVPFSSPGNFLRRWFSEQFMIFPLFLATGRWWRQFRNAGREADDAS